jgi:uncharacterized SAM-binding protein YcdF (DUF218 family)
MPDLEFMLLYGRGPLSKNGTLHPDASARCDLAVRVGRELLAQGKNIVILFCVGPKPQGLRDATILYLQQSGWPDGRIMARGSASDTWGETKTAQEIIFGFGARRVIVVSSKPHMKRISDMWRCAGFTGEITKYSSRVTNRFSSWFWERVAFWKFRRMKRQGWLHQVQPRHQ